MDGGAPKAELAAWTAAAAGMMAVCGLIAAPFILRDLFWKLSRGGMGR